MAGGEERGDVAMVRMYSLGSHQLRHQRSAVKYPLGCAPGGVSGEVQGRKIRHTADSRQTL